MNKSFPTPSESKFIPIADAFTPPSCLNISFGFAFSSLLGLSDSIISVVSPVLYKCKSEIGLSVPIPISPPEVIRSLSVELVLPERVVKMQDLLQQKM